MWSVDNVESRVVLEDGKQVLTLAPVGGNRKGSNVGIALVAGVTCEKGATDVDLRGHGEAKPSFVGIGSADAVERSHAVQYIAWPEHTWEALRAQTPGVYEAAITPVPDPAGWFHARIEIRRTAVKVFGACDERPIHAQ